jgi:hypothetical protein
MTISIQISDQQTKALADSEGIERELLMNISDLTKYVLLFNSHQI